MSFDSRFYVYDLDMDVFMNFELEGNRAAVEVLWDKNDPRFFVVQTMYLKSQKTENSENKLVEEFKGKEISTFFCTSETGIKRQDNYRLGEDFEGLFGSLYINFEVNFCG